MSELNRTVLFDTHVAAGAKMVPFGGWEMPVQYPGGIIEEHLATRQNAGLFDVSHMGRFVIRGEDALPFLQHVLTNNAAGLEVEESQYTMIPNETGGAIDDAYLYRFVEEEYLLVVNAANRLKDWEHFQEESKWFSDVEIMDKTSELAMISLQGPRAKEILAAVLDEGQLPEPLRNSARRVAIHGIQVDIGRTGYTGEPLCFELFLAQHAAEELWGLLTAKGAQPVGLGARDTLRLEAGLPLYGHELGEDPAGDEIPIFACGLARFAVSLSDLKGSFIGRTALERQFEAFKKIVDRNFDDIQALPRVILPVAMTGKGVPRAGYKVFAGGRHVGFVTSGTMVPFWEFQGEGIASHQTEERGLRGIALALVDSALYEGDVVQIEIRSKMAEAIVVPYHMRSEAPPFARPIAWDHIHQAQLEQIRAAAADQKVRTLVDKAIYNHTWRQQACINLIPSEQTLSPLAKLLSMTDPEGRYAEHKQVPAFSEAEVFYYQGTDFIAEVEEMVKEEVRTFLGCRQVEPRVVSGQMANTAVFSALVDYINRADRKSEQRRLRKVINNHIIKGGHLSAQPMGALRDFVARDPKTEKPAVVNFPVKEENPYQIDVIACREIIEEHRPELIIFGKSMVLHKEPVGEIRAMLEEMQVDCTVMYDMAHVLGLAGPYFQEPFQEGVDVVTGSTHKTYFGTQRGVVAANIREEDPQFEFWEAVQRRAFPGSVSNHHLGTLLGLLMAAYEMNYFKDPYQQQIIRNAKAFAQALHTCGLKVAGDPGIAFTETHQVIIDVGYGKGPEAARRLEENNIIVNYQAAPEEEGFTAAGSLRMGVQEMTRFGMVAEDFEVLAQFMRDALIEGARVKDKVADFRRRFVEMQYCFGPEQYTDLIDKLHRIL